MTLPLLTELPAMPLVGRLEPAGPMSQFVIELLEPPIETVAVPLELSVDEALDPRMVVPVTVTPESTFSVVAPADVVVLTRVN